MTGRQMWTAISVPHQLPILFSPGCLFLFIFIFLEPKGEKFEPPLWSEGLVYPEGWQNDGKRQREDLKGFLLFRNAIKAAGRDNAFHPAARLQTGNLVLRLYL